MKKLLFIICMLTACVSFGQGNWTLSGAKNRWANGIGFSSKSTGQLTAFTNGSDSLLVQWGREDSTLYIRYSVGGPWRKLSTAGDLSGFVTGPASVNANAMVVYNGTTGKVIKNSSLIVTELGGPDNVVTLKGKDTTDLGYSVELVGGAGAEGGYALLAAGTPTNGNGTYAEVIASNGVGTNRNGGQVKLIYGNKTGSGSNGKVNIALEGTGGALLDADSLTTTPRNIKFQNRSGTLAYLDNIPSLTGYALTDLSNVTTTANLLNTSGLISTAGLTVSGQITAGGFSTAGVVYIRPTSVSPAALIVRTETGAAVSGSSLNGIALNGVSTNFNGAQISSANNNGAMIGSNDATRYAAGFGLSSTAPITVTTAIIAGGGLSTIGIVNAGGITTSGGISIGNFATFGNSIGVTGGASVSGTVTAAILSSTGVIKFIPVAASSGSANLLAYEGGEAKTSGILVDVPNNFTTISNLVVSNNLTATSVSALLPKVRTSTGTVSVPNNTATTIFTPAGTDGSWMVTLTPISGDPDWSWFGYVTASSGTIKLRTVSAGNTSMAVSGSNIQATQYIGSTINYNVSVIKLF